MQVKDRQYLANIINKVGKSATTTNEKILAYRNGKASVEQLHAAVALEQLGMQHEILLALGILIIDPVLAAEPLPEMPKKILGFI
jgi:hypothetical protein